MPNLIMCRNEILNFIILLKTHKKSRKSLPTKDTEEQKRNDVGVAPVINIPTIIYGCPWSDFLLLTRHLLFHPRRVAGCDIVKRYQNNNKCQGSLMNKIKD